MLPALVALLLGNPATVTAACLSAAQVAQMVAAYQAGTPALNPPAMSVADAECSRTRFNHALQAYLGEPVGYKAGLTNAAVQQRFRYNSPVRGTLYAPMLLQSGATVPAAFGARGVFEADLLVRVSKAAINRATTPAQVLQAIDQVIPFIELPDLLVTKPTELDGPAIMAINVGARLGVMGAPIPVAGDTTLADSLRDMQVIVRGNGAELDRGRGSDVLGHPLNAVIWLAGDLADNGLALRPGDLVSLGSFSRLLPPAPGLAVAIEYLGLPGNPRVEINFE